MTELSRRNILRGAASVALIASYSSPARPDTAAPAKANEPPNDQSPAAGGARVYKAVPQLGRLRNDVLYGDVWKQPEMSPRDRSIVTCSVLAALGRTEELQAHVRRAIDNGVTKDQLRGLAVQVAFYAGWPAGIAVATAALPFLEPEK